MQEIINNIKNNKRIEALKALDESSYLLEDLFEELLSNEMAEEIIKMYRVAVKTSYIKL